MIENPQVKQSDCVSFKKIHIDARLPFYASELAAGADLFAVIDERNNEVVIEPHQHRLVKTGLELAHMDDSYELQVRPRSGLALNHGITVLNAPGTIDPDYRGEIGVILLNTSDKSFTVRTGDRIAQIVAVKRHNVFFQYVESTTQTKRGTGGFGSTGVCGVAA